ncbi:head-tail connector protein [Sphingomonas sp. 3-13AW]|uniref:head-tail connector protein n=1 Tax=Sphingomonas sp. 3-13AW TaxID=3050450 RepID=UPI003BB80B5B
METPPIPQAAIAAACAAAAAHLRIGVVQEGAVLEQAAATAFAVCEAFTGHALIARDWQAVVPAAASWSPLPVQPVFAIHRIEGLPADGAAFPLPSDSYAIDLTADGVGWVKVMLPGSAGRLRVGFRAGLADGWASLPPPLSQGIVLLMVHLFANGSAGGEPPAAVAALWRPWRRMRLAPEVRR